MLQVRDRCEQCKMAKFHQPIPELNQGSSLSSILCSCTKDCADFMRYPHTGSPCPSAILMKKNANISPLP